MCIRDRDDYLNIWVCDLSGGILGYATPPSSWPNPNDGVVVGYRYFGTTGALQSPYNKGRTATHEVGHWLNLDHVWGDNNCGNDNVSDTPTQEEANLFCPGFPHNANSCGTSNSNGDMFMNYMDYTNDACMNLFTSGQKARMISAINQYRPNLLNHNLCDGPNSFEDIHINTVIFPNPTNSFINIQIEPFTDTDIEILLTNFLGQDIYSKQMNIVNESKIKIDLGDMSEGIYFVSILTNRGQLFTQQISYIK